MITNSVILKKLFIDRCDKWCFQLEQGGNTNRLHFQYTVHGKKKINRAGWANCIRELLDRTGEPGYNGTRSVTALQVENKHAAINYVNKPETRVDGPWMAGFEHPQKANDMWKDWYTNKKIVWKPWQERLIALAEAPSTDDRRVLWMWDRAGNIGKTLVARYLVVHRENTMVVSGGAKYAKSALARFPRTSLIIMHLPRSQEGFVSYDSLECIKDGIFFNAFSHDCGMVLLCPGTRVWVFANFPPEEEKLSHDRWTIVNLANSIEWAKLVD